MSWMHNNVWVSLIPIMIIMKIEYTIPGKTSLLEFALFINSLYDFFSLILGVQSASKVGPTSYETSCIYI